MRRPQNRSATTLLACFGVPLLGVLGMSPELSAQQSTKKPSTRRPAARKPLDPVQRSLTTAAQTTRKDIQRAVSAVLGKLEDREERFRDATQAVYAKAQGEVRGVLERFGKGLLGVSSGPEGKPYAERLHELAMARVDFAMRMAAQGSSDQAMGFQRSSEQQVRLAIELVEQRFGAWREHSSRLMDRIPERARRASDPVASNSMDYEDPVWRMVLEEELMAETHRGILSIEDARRRHQTFAEAQRSAMQAALGRLQARATGELRLGFRERYSAGTTGPSGPIRRTAGAGEKPWEQIERDAERIRREAAEFRRSIGVTLPSEVKDTAPPPPPPPAMPATKESGSKAPSSRPSRGSARKGNDKTE